VVKGEFDRLGRACKIEMLVFLTRRPWGRRCFAGSDCHRGGIGRRAWFRSMYRQRCGGSSPFDGTKQCYGSLKSEVESLPLRFPQRLPTAVRRVK
jgi:hypothetical protein